MARRTWRPFQPTYTPGTYTRIGVQSLSDSELAREYSRVRREATERLRSFQRASDPALREAAVVAEKAGMYLNRQQIKQAGGGRAMMEDLLIDAYRFVSAKSSSVSGFRDIQEKQIAKLQAKGYDFVDRSNLREFGQFMDYFRDRRDSKSFGSGSVASAFSLAQKAGIKPEDLKRHFRFYLEQIKSGAEDLQKFQAKPRKKSKSGR